MATTGPETGIGGSQRAFQPTLWTDILRAKNHDAPEHREAVDRLIQNYWKPVYFFLRRRGNDVETSKDLTQGFFTEFLERDFLKNLDPAKGKFRTFLLTTLVRYAANEHERARAKKRGGTKVIRSLDTKTAERDLKADTSSGPEEAFERAWAAELLARAFDQMKNEPYYEALHLHLTEGLGATGIARRLKRNPKDAENALARGRRRFREILLSELLGETGSRAEAEDEFSRLLKKLLPS